MVSNEDGRPNEWIPRRHNFELISLRYKENKPLSAPGDLRIIPKDDRSSNEQMAMLRNTTRLRKSYQCMRSFNAWNKNEWWCHPSRRGWFLKQTVLDRPGRRVPTTSFLELSERIWERGESSQCREAEVIFQGNRGVFTEGIQPSTYMLTESRSFYNPFPPLPFNYSLQAKRSG